MSELFHFPLAASSAARWVACPGSVALCALYPGEDSPASLEGTAAHWVASESILNAQASIGTVAPNGVEVTEEMLDAADMYAMSVLDVARLGGALHIEKTMACHAIHSDCGGTPDAWHHDSGIITIWDFKYGHGFVDVFENWQLITYAAGILEQLGVKRGSDVDDQFFTLRFRVVQPRNYHRDGPIREWVINASELRPYFNILRAAAGAAWLRVDAKCVPNSECRYCSARHVCEAVQQAGFSAMEYSGSPVPLVLSDAALGTELSLLNHHLARLEARKTGLEEMAASEIKAGKVVPGFALESTSGRVGWTKPIEEVIALGQMMGVDISKPGACTPTQAIKAGLPEDLVGSYSERKVGGLKLVSSSSAGARRAFGRTA
jgi:hypothetical protein